MGRGSFEIIKQIVDSVLSTIYGIEEKCIICEEYEENDYICAKCKKNINIINIESSIIHEDEEFKSYSLGFYGYELKKLILKLKYNKSFLAGKILANYMNDFILKNLKDKVDILTFIPSSKSALKSRGFNQCEVLCKYISKSCEIPYKELLYKASDSADQIGLDNIKRWENIKDSFIVKNKKYIEGKRVLIIDDVITSGATAFYAAKAIKKINADEVFILTVAKSRV
ncbi:phosphoribosyltransferase family protein [uncultured Clostridium sp.]|uniref:ComF family protein n=1 Tax=uncultured Clostridium sp. TaxID=59620 RepID=UPI003217CCC9